MIRLLSSPATQSTSGRFSSTRATRRRTCPRTRSRTGARGGAGSSSTPTTSFPVALWRTWDQNPSPRPWGSWATRWGGADGCPSSGRIRRRSGGNSSSSAPAGNPTSCPSSRSSSPGTGMPSLGGWIRSRSGISTRWCRPIWTLRLRLGRRPLPRPSPSPSGRAGTRCGRATRTSSSSGKPRKARSTSPCTNPHSEPSGERPVNAA
mmetsp:Transcript_12543/g.32491  ORF Transcript_12543/g.32491 Transcript_12543/m.32491 type:complete len:206 (+) Transcript_12543:93-710(+)